MNAPDFRHARSELSRNEHVDRTISTPGGADQSSRCREFNAKRSPRHAATVDGMQSSAPGRDNAPSVEMHARCKPCELLLELQILAAISAFPSVLARFKALGVGPDIFAWPAIALLARFVMTWDRPDPPPVLQEQADAMRDPLDGCGLNLGDELDDRVETLQACPTGDTWALRDLDRALAALARYWLPEVLRHLADMYEHGDATRAERLVLSLVCFISTTGGIA